MRQHPEVHQTLLVLDHEGEESIGHLLQTGVENPVSEVVRWPRHGNLHQNLVADFGVDNAGEDRTSPGEKNLTANSLDLGGVEQGEELSLRLDSHIEHNRLELQVISQFLGKTLPTG